MIYTLSEKYISLATIPSLTLRVYLHSFSRCCLTNLRNSSEILKKFELIALQSSKVIDLGVNRKPQVRLPIISQSKEHVQLLISH